MTQLGPYGEADIEEIATTLLSLINASPYTLWCFDGAMGAGKTTTISRLLAVAGIEDRISSPTFSIVNEYFSPTLGPVYHFDFYRIETEEEAIDIGTLDYFDSGNLCLLEWSSQIPHLLPPNYGVIAITVDQEDQRTIKIHHHE